MARFENPYDINNSSWIIEGSQRWFVERPFEILSDKSGNGFIELNEIRVSTRADIVIVIDPGHGNTLGNTGSSFIKAYKHKIKDENGYPAKDSNGNYIIVESFIENLPDYVKIEVTKNESDWKWITKRVYDNNKLERDLVWDVSLILESLLTSAGYTAYLTRTEKIIQGSDNRKHRTDFANRKKAHYFVSIHADGSFNFEASGSHAIYRPNNNVVYSSIQEEFAVDIFKYYNVVSKVNSPRVSKSIQVLSPVENNSYRKTLVELGFITNPNDYASMINNKNLIARQIAKGIEINIFKHYYKIEQDIVGYVFNGKIYATEKEADVAYRKFLRDNQDYLLLKNVDGISGMSILTPKPQYRDRSVRLEPTII